MDISKNKNKNKKIQYNQIAILLGWLFAGLFSLPLFPETRASIPHYSIVVDPGHGGAPDRRKLDKWDDVHRRFLDRFAYGGVYKNYHEHRLVLPLAKRVAYYLSLTQSPSGWKKFEKILRKFSSQKKFSRLVFVPHLTRKHSYSDFSYSKRDPRNHEPYLLYDYPDRRRRGHKKQGRLSVVNSYRPYLVLSLHTTPAARGKPGGMGAVLAPGYATFDLIRRISLGKEPVKKFYKTPWADKWLVTDKGWSKYEAARSDAWVYFHGYKTRKGKPLRRWTYRGFRYNMVQWRYADPPGWEKLARLGGPGPYSKDHRLFRPSGRFWDRERSLPEKWRREGGPLGYGGDNHYASDQLLRFVQYGNRLQVSKLRASGAIGPIVKPWVSSFSLPTFTNAIVAYLEIAHTNRWKDRRLLLAYREATARSLAVGVYALFEKLRLRPITSPYKPRPNPLDFQKYETWKDGNYFRIVVK